MNEIPMEEDDGNGQKQLEEIAQQLDEQAKHRDDLFQKLLYKIDEDFRRIYGGKHD